MIVFSGSCFGHEEFNRFVWILDQSLAQGRLKLEPFGLTGVVTLQRTAEGSDSLFSPRGVHDLFTTKIIVREWTKFLVFLSLPPILVFSSAHLLTALRRELFFDMCDRTSSHIFPGLVVTCFFVNLPWTHMCPSGGSLLTDSKLVTPTQGSVPINMLIIIDGSLMKYIKARFRWSVDVNATQRYRTIVLWNIKRCCTSNMTAKKVVSQNAPETW